MRSDSTGTFVYSLGGRGSGPGEFQHAGPSFWAGDTTVVWDARLGRATYLLPDGTVVRTENPQFFGPNFGVATTDSAFFAFNPSAVDDAGAMLGLAYLSVSSGGVREPERRVVLRVSRDGSARVVATPPPYDDERWMITVSGVSNPVPFAFEPRTEFSADGSRFLFAMADQSTLAGGTYTLTMLRPSGDTIFERSYAFVGDPIPAPALDSAIAAMAPRPELASRFRALARERAPAVYAPIGGLTLGLDGTVWVELRSTEREARVLVLDPAGDSIGSLHLPARSRIQRASMAHVWVTETDAFGLASVVRYRVTGPN